MELARRLKDLAKRLPGFRALDRYLCYRYTGWYVPERFPRGHFYSPLPGYADMAARAEGLFHGDLEPGPGLDIAIPEQSRLLMELAAFSDGFDWPTEQEAGYRYYAGQHFFTGGDAFCLYALMRYLKPARIIEVGSGFSSVLMLDVAERFLGGSVSFSFIEPHPERLKSLLLASDVQQHSVLEAPLQDVPLETFESLRSGDILFVDSSHVTKTGSDLNRLVFDILPRLEAGVAVHFHDVFWPFEYPEEWVMDGRGWNEAYLLRAFLQYNNSFRVMFWPGCLAAKAGELLREHLPVVADHPGGSLWLQRL